MFRRHCNGKRQAAWMMYCLERPQKARNRYSEEFVHILQMPIKSGVCLGPALPTLNRVCYLWVSHMLETLISQDARQLVSPSTHPPGDIPGAESHPLQPPFLLGKTACLLATARIIGRRQKELPPLESRDSGNRSSSTQAHHDRSSTRLD
jgi:hypothetical protein